MNWWLNLYFSEGPGIAKDAPQPTGLRRVGATIAREWWNLVLLNLLFIAAALPIVTLPAAFVAMVRVTAKMVEDQPHDLWHDFRTGFTQLFWSATLTGAACAIAIALAGFVTGFYFSASFSVLAMTFPMTFAAAMTLIAVMSGGAALVLVATTDARSIILMQSAALTALRRPVPILMALIANAGLWLAHVAFYPSTVLLAVVINFSLGALLLTFAVHPAAQASLSYIRSRGEAEQQEKSPDKPARIQPT